MSKAAFGWTGIIRIGLVQASIGAMVMLTTSLLNRVMVVEYGLAAAIPAGLVGWHYAVQLSRPAWGHGSDGGGRRTPWIIGGMGLLVLGALLAVDATLLMGAATRGGALIALLAFTFIGAGVGAAGTSLLALLANGVAPERRAAAAAITWIMMVAGIAISAGVAGSLLDPYSEQRLAIVSGGVGLTAFGLTLLALAGLEKARPAAARPRDNSQFARALRTMLAEPEARRFTLFVFVSMLAYSMQDLILEPFAGLVFSMSPGASTQLSGAQHGGVLAGMILAGVGGSAFAGRGSSNLRRWIVLGCLGSALCLAGLSAAATVGPGWPLTANVILLGFMNGIFAVAAIGSMMALAGAGSGRTAGIRMGVWGAAQAIAFGLGGLIGAIGVDAARALLAGTGQAFQLIFGLEALLFLAAALLASRAPVAEPSRRIVTA